MLPLTIAGSHQQLSARNRRPTWRAQLPNLTQSLPSNRDRILTSPKLLIAIAITFIIILAQVLIFQYYISLTSNTSLGFFDSVGQANKLGQLSDDDWNCIYPSLSDIYELARNFDVDLVVIDPDLLTTIDRTFVAASGSVSSISKTAESSNRQDQRSPSVVFSSGLAGTSKRSQESIQKTIIHLAAINETSGGQPNLKLFYNALKHNGYTTLKYDDTSQLMQPEVYRRASHLFDDMPLDGVRGHKYSHDSNSKHSEHIIDSLYGDREGRSEIHHDDDEVSKIYIEFMTHIFILNNTSPISGDDHNSQQNSIGCGKNKVADAEGSPFTVIHVLILYNYEYNPTDQWIQPGLIMDEQDKHKLLAYNVHSFDFKIPIEQYYIHPKRPVVDIVKPTIRGAENRGRRKRSLERIRVFEPEGDRLLNYANNSHIHCTISQFNISGLIDNSKRLSKYLKALDSAKPIEDDEARQSIQRQLATALQFMDVYSKAYGNFSYWITGSSLLAYYKYCDLALVPLVGNMDFFAGSEMDPNQEEPYSFDNIVINLELGLFSSEVNETVLEDLATAHTIGVSMMADWRKSNALITFHLRDCPNLVFNIYPYELRRDFYQYYFITRNTMTMSHKFTKRARVNRYTRPTNSMHHVFNTNNLDLCWTRIDNFHPFRVPCNVYEHLRRIFII